MVRLAKQVKPSARNELEITDLNKLYLEAGKLKVKLLGRGYAWLDTGTIDSLLDAASFMSLLEKRQGIKVCVPEEIAYINKWLSAEALQKQIELYGEKNTYGQYLKKVLTGDIQY